MLTYRNAHRYMYILYTIYIYIYSICMYIRIYNNVHTYIHELVENVINNNRCSQIWAVHEISLSSQRTQMFD